MPTSAFLGVVFFKGSPKKSTPVFGALFLFSETAGFVEPDPGNQVHGGGAEGQHRACSHLPTEDDHK